ncbi:hypothetical protein DF3PA_120042 [Candidatus Defluviicoccus seviourii]|uniref:Uncharacterized protein n=1 Tax=Candidatus Defluviicoccus seviourii TaxID=2565273 RepID=A0A564WBD4_9PROT|nr:hypothetical protein DF3PA_120042 [Candidatus Defluviicoccus seviourii]
MFSCRGGRKSFSLVPNPRVRGGGSDIPNHAIDGHQVDDEAHRALAPRSRMRRCARARAAGVGHRVALHRTSGRYAVGCERNLSD